MRSASSMFFIIKVWLIYLIIQCCINSGYRLWLVKTAEMFYGCFRVLFWLKHKSFKLLFQLGLYFNNKLCGQFKTTCIWQQQNATAARTSLHSLHHCPLFKHCRMNKAASIRISRIVNCRQRRDVRCDECRTVSSVVGGEFVSSVQSTRRD